MSTIDALSPAKQRGNEHPEQGPNEVYLGNFDPPFVEKLRGIWKTLRVGNTAYDDNGVPYPATILPHLRPVPVFTERTEALERHYAFLYGKNE